MKLKFFSPSEIEKYYGKCIDEISPVDTPLDKFMAGHGITACEKCGNNLDVKCGYNESVNSLDAFIDYAYCSNCDLEHVRERTLVDETDNADYSYSIYRTDEREEYLCKHCNQRHPFTIPNGAFETSNLEIKSHESITFTCKCGEVIYLNNIKFSETKECLNCDREYGFIVSE